MKKKIILYLWIIFALCVPGRFAYSQEAAEKILSFLSDIRLDPDGSMTVTESITVYAAADKIKHGIYRDFPTRYKDRAGHNYTVDFQVTEVLRDGVNEPYRIEPLANGSRVYIGSKDLILVPQKYTYKLSYRTNRQVGFFKDYDELYWNVTGNGWDFPIEEAIAIVWLPYGAAERIIAYDGYTGISGAKGKDFVARIDTQGADTWLSIAFYTTRSLAPTEGLTIAVSWPKGYVAEPDIKKKINYFLRDNRVIAFGLLGLAVLIGYYMFVWYLFGKDPAKGTIIPLYKPPENITPQAMRYIMKMAYDSKVFGCAVIDIAVKGFLTIHEENAVFTLRKTGMDASGLSVDEQELARTLLSEKEITLENTRHSTISSAIQTLKYFLKRNYEKSYFFTNIKYFIPGLAFSVAVLIASVFFQAGPDLPVAMFMSVWLTFWSFGVFFLMGMVFSAWKAYVNSGARSAALLGQAVFISLFSVPFAIGELFGIGVFVSTAGVALLPFMVLFVLTNLLFYRLLKAPTPAGRRVMDKIEGFKMYLGIAEKDRLNSVYGSTITITPELFEQYLPYALALDVEQAWAERFSDYLKKAGMEGQTYQPQWYSGIALSSLGASGFVSRLGGSVSGAISSASHAPGSSSGSGGGGSSGGGGGGGGGGGW